MDKYGHAHWIPDMDNKYLHNALRYAVAACRRKSNAWWDFASLLRGEMAINQAERTAMRYDELDVPLVKGLRNEIARRRHEQPPFEQWELEGYVWDMYMEDRGMDHYAVLDATRNWIEVTHGDSNVGGSHKVS